MAAPAEGEVDPGGEDGVDVRGSELDDAFEVVEEAPVGELVHVVEDDDRVGQ